MTARRCLPILPPIPCPPDCGDCCGIVPVSTLEWLAVAAYARNHGITAREQGLSCPFLHDGRCAVHPVRPVLCRAFGHVRGMTCPKGHQRPVPEAAVHAAVVSEPRNRTLHSFVDPEAP